MDDECVEFGLLTRWGHFQPIVENGPGASRSAPLQETSVTARLKHAFPNIFTESSIAPAYLMTGISINRPEAV